MDEQTLEVASFIRRNPLVTLATLEENGEPHLASLYLLPLGEELSFGFVTRAASRKSTNAQERTRVTVLGTSEAELTTVEMKGTATRITDPTEIIQAVETFEQLASSKYSRYWVPPVAQLADSSYVAFRFVPTQIHFARYQEAGTVNPTPYIFDLTL